jgi:hypothetical protein
MMLSGRWARFEGKKTVTSVMWACWMLAVFTAHAETVTVHSGNGSVGGRDSAVTFLLGPTIGGVLHAFTAADFQSAQTGLGAYVITPSPRLTLGFHRSMMTR